MEYYIYAYVRTDGTPYYIGKGKALRYKHKNHKCGVPKDSRFIVIMESGLTNVGACALERRYIRWYGRKDLGTGILRNLTDGGECSDGWSPTEETKRKISKSKQGKKRGPQSEDHKKKRLESFLSNPLRKEKYRQVGQKTKERCSFDWIITTPNGEVLEVRSMSDFCKRNNIERGGLHQTYTGKLKQYKGYTATKKQEG